MHRHQLAQATTGVICMKIGRNMLVSEARMLQILSVANFNGQEFESQRELGRTSSYLALLAIASPSHL